MGQFSTRELENLLGKFPYFHQAHVLLAKKYQQEKDFRFDEQLQLAALYTQDREFLFSLFNEKDVSVFYEPPVKLPEPIKEEEVVVPQNIIKEEEPAVLAEELHEQTVIDEPFIEEIAVEQTPLVDVVNEVPQEVKTIETEEAIPPVEPAEEAKEESIVTEPHTFAEWLVAFNKQDLVVKPIVKSPIVSPPIEEYLEPEKELEQLYLSNLPLQELVEEETHYSKGLDRFIEEQKLKHKPQETRAAANENELAPELITETIAKVYEAQKKYAKAIRAYEILALKYPEKNDFFATRIIELKNNL